MSLGWRERAVLEDPLGATCGFCGAINHFFDDLGWFYLNPDGDGPGIPRSAACKDCYHGEPGEAHKTLYGVGER